MDLTKPHSKEEYNWLKKNFYSHSDYILKQIKGEVNPLRKRELTDNEKKRMLWRLFRDCSQYAYAKGYKKGMEKGIVKGAILQQEQSTHKIS